MARKSVTARNKRREKLVEKYHTRREKIKNMLKDPNLSPQEHFEIRINKLAKLPRDSSLVRIRNRCELTGRPRGFYRKFKLSRVILRDLAAQGMLPGVKKYSW